MHIVSYSTVQTWVLNSSHPSLSNTLRGLKNRAGYNMYIYHIQREIRDIRPSSGYSNWFSPFRHYLSTGTSILLFTEGFHVLITMHCGLFDLHRVPQSKEHFMYLTISSRLYYDICKHRVTSLIYCSMVCYLLSSLRWCLVEQETVHLCILCRHWLFDLSLWSIMVTFKVIIYRVRVSSS